LLAAATELFAARGFHGTSIREIAERAGANVAATHYHHGSKEGLYLEVLRDQFARVRVALDRRGATSSPAVLRRATRAQLVDLLERRMLTMLENLLGPPPTAHGALMLREMCDPTDALPIIVAEFIAPQVAEMEAIVAQLAPRARRETVRDAALGLIAQGVFYHFTMPAMLLLLGRDTYPKGFTTRMARSITELSLNGLNGMAGRRRDDHRARARGRRTRRPNRTGARDAG
jgi:AcrR family transcriptional regulator